MTEIKNEPELSCAARNATAHSENTHKLCTYPRHQGLSETYLHYMANVLTQLEKHVDLDNPEIEAVVPSVINT